MDSKEQAKKGPRSPKVDSPADPVAHPESPTDTTRPSQMGSAYGETYGQGPMSISAPPPPDQAHEHRMAKMFRFFLIGSIVADLIVIIMAVIIIPFYAAVKRETYLLENGTELPIGKTFFDDDGKEQTISEFPRDLSKAGIPIAYVTAVVCAVCLIIDALCIVLGKSFGDPKGRKAILYWLIATGIFTLVVMIQVIIPLLIIKDKGALTIVPDVDRAEFSDEEIKSMRNKLELSFYISLLLSFAALLVRVALIKPVIKMKNALRGVGAGPVFIPPDMPTTSGEDPGTGTGTGATSPTGTATTATSQNTGSPA